MTDHCDNEVALPKLKYPIHQYKILRIKASISLQWKVVVSRDVRLRTQETFYYESRQEALQVLLGLKAAHRSMRALLSTDED